MRIFIAVILALTVSACSTLEGTGGRGDAPLIAHVQTAGADNWISSDGSSYPGIPGNLGYFPGTTSFDGPVRVIIPGESVFSRRVEVRVIGAHEFVDKRGATTTIIAVPVKTEMTYQNLGDLESEHPGVLALIEQQLLEQYGMDSRSVGFRTAEYAEKALEQSF